MHTPARFLSRNGATARQLAIDLMLRAVGERIPTTVEYGRQLGAGSGTIQKAFSDLVDLAAVQVKAHGHQGTFLVAKNLTRLWEAAALGPCTGCMPLPTSREFQGLAAGLRREFDQLGLPLSMMYCHGAELRLQALLGAQVDFIVCSRYLAEHARAQQDELEISMDLGDGTYYAQQSVVLVSALPISDPTLIQRVGIDHKSPDHLELTRAEFGNRSVQFLEVPYTDIPDAIEEGLIDGAVWHRTVLSLSLEQAGLRVHELQSEHARSLSLQMSAATVLCRSGSPACAVFPLIGADRVRGIQRQVIEKALRPVY